ncbi:MAG TPA: 50S ribosomal protein L5 [Candidatus Paceibacterota bacterium]|nr:50S ribosomal protein L5 [Candidatus Paceibacterota bacterium]
MPTIVNKESAARRKEVRGFLEKIVLDAGVGRLSQTPNFEEKALVQVMRDLAAMTGQKAETRRAKKSIAGFKVRENQIVGLRITLRRDKMVDFFERLIRIVLPRVRDFGGLETTNIDTHGVLNTGIREQAVFPEISPENSPVIFSFGITMVPRVKERAKALAEFRRLGVPLKDDTKAKAKK